MQSRHWCAVIVMRSVLCMATASPSAGSASTHGTVGVLGGMGPLATVDFLRKLVEATPARTDQDHIPLLVRFCPEIPDRSEAVLGRGPSPLKALREAARSLEEAGAGCIAIPCNTAHLWHDDIARALGIPILHIADAALADAARTGPARRVGLLATSATLKARIYQSRGDALCWIEPDPAEVEACVMPGIRAVKSNRIDEGRRLLSKAAHRLLDRGADRLLLACTEIPIALADVPLPVPVIDPTLALARACVQWARAGHGGMQPA